MIFSIAFTVLSLVGSPTAAQPADSLRPDRDIRFVAMRHAGDVRGCYEREGLRRNPTLQGTVEVALTVLPTGAVDSVTVDSSKFAGVGAAEVVSCIRTLTRHWRFERGPFGIETVVFPFRLLPNRESGPTLGWQASDY